MDGGVGATLREARNRRKLELSEVEDALKLRVRMLRALENEEWETLPGGSYTRGFVRTYADYLGLDGERLAAEYDRAAGAAQRGAGPRIEPEPVRPAGGGRDRRPPTWVIAAMLGVALAAVAIVVGVSAGGGGEAPRTDGKASKRTAQSAEKEGRGAAPAGMTLRLSARAEVWACVLDAGGKPLVDGEILSPGAEAGPFRSGSFTVAFGNGAVEMSIDGKQIPIPESASPIGYTIGRNGGLSELAEGERPTCT